jgi:hypothetical protein
MPVRHEPKIPNFGINGVVLLAVAPPCPALAGGAPRSFQKSINWRVSRSISGILDGIAGHPKKRNDMTQYTKQKFDLIARYIERLQHYGA